ncbi:MAG: hypothetical protein FWC89_13430 [Defluviitaleaceae bacterium]|nr:hypothetical protein [Defluviitaleaceae bacterium]
MNISSLQQTQDKHNEIYSSAKAGIFSEEMFVAGNPANNEWLNLANTRINQLCETLANISESDIDAAPSYVAAIDVLVSFFDDVILECAELSNRRAEVEGKIIDKCRHAIAQPTENGTRIAAEEHVISRFIDCLNKIEDHDITLSVEMAVAMLDDTNPLRLGFTFYEDFCKQYPASADMSALDYLRTEADVRMQLILGNNEAVVAGLDKLLASSFNCPEKYLLTALNSFYHGFQDDAVRALEIGLNFFPNNERLLSAKGALVS